MTRTFFWFLAFVLWVATALPAGPLPVRGLTNSAAIARAYDTILDADFAKVPARLSEACEPASVDHDDVVLAPARQAPHEVCRVLEAMSLWWEISLDPDNPQSDGQFTHIVEQAIMGTTRWAQREPDRAEAWFYQGAAYGARSQWRVLRGERMAAARDGKHIKEALERSLALDPSLHDANFGIGLYRYYADVAPAALRMLRWLFLMPGGDREGGLAQISEARAYGQLVRGEADYQLHLIYLWYEQRPADALNLIEGLQERYPANPLFSQIEADIHDVYRHDPASSYAASARLLARSVDGQINEPALASVQARLNMARQLARLGTRQEAITVLEGLIAERPTRPHDAAARAQRLLRSINLMGRR